MKRPWFAPYLEAGARGSMQHKPWCDTAQCEHCAAAKRAAAEDGTDSRYWNTR